jgi:hypothetical protein
MHTLGNVCEGTHGCGGKSNNCEGCSHTTLFVENVLTFLFGGSLLNEIFSVGDFSTKIFIF